MRQSRPSIVVPERSRGIILGGCRAVARVAHESSMFKGPFVTNEHRWGPGVHPDGKQQAYVGSIHYIRLVRLGGKRYAEADTRGSRGSCAYGWH